MRKHGASWEVLPTLKIVLVSKICQAFYSHFHFHSLERLMGVMLVMVMLVMVMIWVMVMLVMVMTTMCFHFQGAASLKP